MDKPLHLTQAASHAALLDALVKLPGSFTGIADVVTGALLEVNPEGARLFGYRPEQMAAMSWRSLLEAASEQGSHPEISGWKQAVFATAGGGRFRGDYLVTAFESDGTPRHLISIRNLEAYRGADKNLQREKQRFEALFNHATMGIVVADAGGRIIQANQFALREFGYSAPEIIGKPVESLIPARFHTHHEAYRHSYNRHPEIRPMGAGRDLFALRSDGTEFPVEVSLSPYQTEEGLFIIAFIIDISVRREKEEEIVRVNDLYRQLTGELEAKVEERTRQLEGTLRELKASRDEISQSLEKEKELNDMKSRFVSMASHEFRTPLSTILSSASLLGKYVLTEDQPKRDKHVQRIKSAVNNLTGILNEFLSLGKMEDGRLEVHARSFDVRALLTAVCTEMRDICKTGQQITFTHRGSTAGCLDAELLRNVMINLLSNAIKFSGEGSKITVESRLAEGGALEVRVRDQGMGISPADKAHLFERFFRGAGAVNIQGTGLGLHIVSKYLELLGGTITCESAPGKGTEFILTFPTAGAPCPAEAG